MGQNNIILGGQNNKIESSTRCTIINGRNNTIDSKTNTHIIGDDITALESNTFYIGCDNGLFCDGDITSKSYFSDARLKEDIQPIKDGLSKLLSIDAVEFDWNDEQKTYKGHDMGVIAQQVQVFFPELVEKRRNGYLAVKYDRFISILIAANNQQLDKLDELKRLTINQLH